jgi:zinc protease
VEHGDIQRAYCKLIWPGPRRASDDLRPVLSVVRRVLSDGRSCRMYRRIQEELKLVDDFMVMTETGPREGVFIIDLETHPERLAQAVRATLGLLAELGRDGCTSRELDRARIRAVRSFLFGEETVQGQASTLGYHEAMDDLEGAFRFPERVAAVGSADVARFCRQVFSIPDLSCMIYLPKGTEVANHGIPETPSALQTLAEAASAGTPAESPPATEDIPTPTILTPSTVKSASDSPFLTALLPGGASLCYRHDPSLPIMAMTFNVKGGATGETSTNSGLSTLAQMVQVKGTGDLSSEAIHETLEGEGAALSPRAERDFTGVSFSALSKRLDTALDLLGRLIVEPSFPLEEIDQERRLALEQLAALRDNPFQAAAVEMRQILYGDHPYGRPLTGTLESLPNLRREHLLEFHHRAWQAANLQIVVSGDFKADHLQDRLAEVLADLPAGTRQEDPRPREAQQPEGVVARRLEREQNQSVVLLGWPGVKHPDEDRAALLMLKEILNGQAGRLFEALRNRRSLCYNTGTLSTAGFGQGMFLAYVLTAPDSEEAARSALLEELSGVGSQPVDKDEFERARAKLLGNMLLASQSNSSRVMRAGQDLMFGRDPNNLPVLVEMIRNTQPEQVREVAGRIITPDHRFQVTMGPKA